MPSFHIKNSKITQFNVNGENRANAAARSTTTMGWLFNAYTLVGTTIGIATGLLSWFGLHQQFGWWFFGL